MKTASIITLLIVSLSACGPGIADAVNRGHLTIRIDGIQQVRGQAVFVLMDSASSHKGDSPVYSKTMQPVDGLYAIAEFDLPPGEYSAVVYHDVNANGKLDTGLFGKPEEPYGFSNDARNAFGIPGFEAARFVVDSTATRLNITVK